jgi:tetratricopeptide (TPR) repeat protein
LSPARADHPALQRLRAVPAERRYATYLDERAANGNDSGFFLDAAELFFADGRPELGVRVAGNLAEMRLESRTLLRVLAFRLMAAEQPAAAVPVLERVLRLAPDEAVSWRDLALALARSGQPQRALDLLWQVARQRWPHSPQGLREVALAELNDLLARHPELNRRDIPPELLRPLPLGLRVVLSWDANDTDVDLMVVDPEGQRCFYAEPLTRHGGRLTHDDTSGYGPEEYGLRVPRPGVYTVRARLYGQRRQQVASEITLMVSLCTGYGSAQAQERQIIRRLRENGDDIELGRITISA